MTNRSRGNPIPPRDEPLRGWIPGSRAQKTDQPATDAQIVAALRDKAGKGDAAAARELREWLDRDLAQEDAWGWLEALDQEGREALRAALSRAKHSAEHDVAARLDHPE
jgi:hypothetical protein